jgi:hypothetical protein
MTRHLARTLALSFLALVAACRNPGQPGTENPGNEPGPFPLNAVIEGTVTLLGQGGTPNPAGVRITLHRTRADADVHKAAYTTTLKRTSAPGRVYSYRFEGVTPGLYYVVACFDFGCGAYRVPATGEYRAVDAVVAATSVLHFGI